ncbi:hypothetical protein SUGI_0571840 [Cryptomeria japonica]|nr:hypothetical protein SUGI_0571840 [Cryptomeria japonica]
MVSHNHLPFNGRSNGFRFHMKTGSSVIQENLCWHSFEDVFSRFARRLYGYMLRSASDMRESYEQGAYMPHQARSSDYSSFEHMFLYVVTFF